MSARAALVLAALAALGLPACAPGAPPYARCGYGVGCAGARCVELLYTLDDGTATGGLFCTERCAADVDCPAPGVCVSVDLLPPLRFLCAPPCVEPSDCFAGTRCAELVGPSDTPRVCLPGG